MSAVSRLHPVREGLSNGITLLWNESHDSPSVAVRASFPAGACRESEEKAGLACLTARLLRRGSEIHTAAQISEAVEDLGASFAVWGGTEESGFSAKCLGRDLRQVLEIIQEVLEKPAFAESEIAKTRGELFTQLREQDDSPRSRADRAMYALLYPAGHPYSRPSVGTRETLEELRREDFQQFHSTSYGAEGMKISIAGAFDPAEAKQTLEGWFLGHRPMEPTQDWRIVMPTPGDSGADVQNLRLSMPHKSQVDMIIGGPGIPRDHPDFFSLSMVNVILGSLGLMGRLGERVREQGGMAYYVSCRSVSRLWAGEWVAHAGVNPLNVERAHQAILEEVERVRDEPVTEEELADAQAYLVGSLPLRMETNDGIAAYLLNAEYYGLGLDYIHHYPGYIRAETRETLQAAARKYMDPSRFHFVAAGPV